MKAVVFPGYGSPDVLRLEDVPAPTPKNDEVLVRVHAASVNSWDWDLLRGDVVNRLIFGLRKARIKILGCDIAGRVEAVGSHVQRFQPGDDVFGDLSGSGWGGFAEYVCAPERLLAPKSVSMTFEEAAAVPQAGLLALQGLRYRGEIRAGQTVLINGAGGGVGTFAIQMAKSSGATVTGVDSADKQGTMLSLGADHVIDYAREDFTRNGRAYDLILDVVGKGSIFEYKRALGPRGTFVMVGGPIWRILQTFLVGYLISRTTDKKMGLLLHQPNRDDLAIMNELFEAGKVAPVIDKQFPLSETGEALRYFAEGHFRGKIVVTVTPAG